VPCQRRRTLYCFADEENVAFVVRFFVSLYGLFTSTIAKTAVAIYSTVTDLARLRG